MKASDSKEAMDVPQPTRSKTTGQKIKDAVLDHLIIILMVLALTIGVVVGLTVRQLEGWEHYQKRKIFYLRFPGDLLMNMLKMLILPLIVSSIISSLASLNAKASGRMGLRAVVYYLTTTFVAVVIGIIMVLSIRPGEQGNEDIEKTGSVKEQEPLEALFDLIRNCFPNNLIESTFRRQTTSSSDYKYNLTFTNESMPANESEYTMEFTTDNPKVTIDDGMNVLGLVVFSVFFGAILAGMGDAGKPLLDFFETLHVATMKLTMLVICIEPLIFGAILAGMDDAGKPLLDFFETLHMATMKLTMFVIRYSPIGIIFLVATKLIEMEDPSKVFVQLGYYMMTVLVGLAAHAIIVLPLVYLIATRKNPIKFVYGMLKAILTAWGTASSSATLPVTMECLRDNNGIDIRVAKFVAPIGATVNMDGTALYEAVAAIFIAQVNGINLNVGEVITVSLTATAAAIGAAGIPSAGLVTMTIVLTAVGLPTEDVTLILAIDWFLDRFRTAVNVLGDSFGAGIVEHLSKADLAAMDYEAENQDVTPSFGTNGDVIRGGKDNGLNNPTFIMNEKDGVRM